MKSKLIPPIVVLFTLSSMLVISCGQNNDGSSTKLVQRIDSLQQQINQLKPGFGDIMGQIQVHHAKLWFAGSAGNWDLTDFELNEIDENIEKIEQLYPDDPRTGDLSRLDPVLDSLTAAVKSQNVELFKKRYHLLTHTCNNCHNDNGYEFNVIKTPERPPVSNQIFNPS